MGILDRLFRGSRMGRFEKKDYLSDGDKKLIKSEVEKVYRNILSGKITKEKGKEHLLGYVTSKVRKRYPRVDFEKSGLAGKINRYVSMKIRKLDYNSEDEDFEYEDHTGRTVTMGERGLQLGEASRLGKIGKIKNELRKQFNKIKKKKGMTRQWAYDYLMEYARSESLRARVGYPEPLQEYEYRNLVMEVIRENYDESGNLKEPPKKPKTPSLGRKRKPKPEIELFPQPYVDGAERVIGAEAGKEYYENKAVKEEVLKELEGVLESIPGLKAKKESE